MHATSNVCGILVRTRACIHLKRLVGTPWGWNWEVLEQDMLLFSGPNFLSPAGNLHKLIYEVLRPGLC